MRWRLLARRLIAVRVNADPGWRATEDGREIPIERDNLGFMVLRPAATAATHIELEYRATAEPRIMAAVSALAWIAPVAARLIRSGERRGGEERRHRGG